MKTREALRRLPIPVTILISVLLAAFFIFGLKGCSLLVSLTKVTETSYYLAHLISEILPLGVFIGITFLFGYSFLFRQNRSGWTAGFYQGGFFTVYCGSLLGVGILRAILSGGDYASFGEILVYVIAIAMVGISEELVFRGVIMNLLLDRFPKTRGGIRAAILINGILFGLIHLTNALSGVRFMSACIQAFQCMFIGVLWAYIYVRTRNFWLVALFHFMMDCSSLLTSGLHTGGSLANSLNQYSSLGPWICLLYLLFLIPIIILLQNRNMDRIVLLEKGEQTEDFFFDAAACSRTCLILGIISIASGYMVGYSIGFAALSLAAGSRIKRSGQEIPRIAKTGTILSIIGLCLGAASVIGYGIYLANADLSQLQNYLSFFK